MDRYELHQVSDILRQCTSFWSRGTRRLPCFELRLGTSRLNQNVGFPFKMYSVLCSSSWALESTGTGSWWVHDGARISCVVKKEKQLVVPRHPRCCGENYLPSWVTLVHHRMKSLMSCLKGMITWVRMFEKISLNSFDISNTLEFI